MYHFAGVSASGSSIAASDFLRPSRWRFIAVRSWFRKLRVAGTTKGFASVISGCDQYMT